MSTQCLGHRKQPANVAATVVGYYEGSSRPLKLWRNHLWRESLTVFSCLQSTVQLDLYEAGSLVVLPYFCAVKIKVLSRTWYTHRMGYCAAIKKEVEVYICVLTCKDAPHVCLNMYRYVCVMHARVDMCNVCICPLKSGLLNLELTFGSRVGRKMLSPPQSCPFLNLQNLWMC